MIVPPIFRFVLIFSLFASGFVAMVLNFSPGVSILMWLMSLLLLSSYFLFGTVNGTLFLLKTGQIDKAKKTLDGTRKPEWLLKSHRAYYFFAKGLIALYESRDATTGAALFLKEGEENLVKSLAIGLPRAQERAMAYLNLAHIAYRNNDKAKTMEYAEGAKANQTGDLHLQKNLEEMDEAIKKM